MSDENGTAGDDTGQGNGATGNNGVWQRSYASFNSETEHKKLQNIQSALDNCRTD